MPEPIKNMLSLAALKEFAEAIKSVYAEFDAEEFVLDTMGDTWDELELMARGRKISKTLGDFLPSKYEDAIAVIDKVVKIYQGFAAFSFPEFVIIYGQDEQHWVVSIAALGRFTEHFSAEFAVRPFIISNEKKMMAQMREWSKSDNEHLRRLSSEGCRPALPWGIGLPKYKKNPSPIFPILEQLKVDPSLYVRKSVANNLNDISKTHPELVIEIAKRWYGTDEKTNWIIKHGLRTLLKKSNADALSIFGLGNADAVEVSDFAINSSSIALGCDITFSFVIKAKNNTKARLEYGIDYMKHSGKQSRKVFQISEIPLKEGQTKTYTRKHALADHSTRKHYLGAHAVTLIVNGQERGTLEFELTGGNN
ncbi:MAG: DNA alkylation repair protein [Firmicutes bacterium]|nr:DNA alkylation repair protein [Bacillota bacterium]